jgi:hypothetical protein
MSVDELGYIVLEGDNYTSLKTQKKCDVTRTALTFIKFIYYIAMICFVIIFAIFLYRLDASVNKFENVSEDFFQHAENVLNEIEELLSKL